MLVCRLLSFIVVVIADILETYLKNLCIFEVWFVLLMEV